MSQPTTYPAPYPTPQAPRGSSAGRIIGIVLTAVVVLGGVAAAALFLFGKPVLDEAKVQAEIVRITKDAAGVEPTGVTCPKDVPLHAGDVSTCTAQLDGQAISYTVRQQDDKGNVHIESGSFLVVEKIEKALVDRFRDQGTSATADCAAGKQVVVGGKGTTIQCTATSTTDASDTTQVTATITDDQGDVDFS